MDAVPVILVNDMVNLPQRELLLLGGGFKYFLFSLYLGKISNLTNIFQMG